MARRLSLKKKIFFSTCVTLFTFALAVAGFEYYGWYHRPVIMGGIVLESFELNHVWKPGASWTHDEFVADNPKYSKPFRHDFNAQGWIESYDVEKSKPPGTYRIFYLGDSFTEGTAPMDQSVPSLVETALNRRAKDKKTGTRFEVINAGTSSYSPLIYYTLLRHVVFDYAPDLVVIQVDMTDDFDDWKYGKTAILDEAGNPWAIPPRNPYESAYFDSSEGVIEANFWTRTQMFLVRNSYFYNYLLAEAAKEKGEDKEVSTNSNTAAIYNRWSWCQLKWDRYTERNVAKTMDVIRRIAIMCQKKGVKLMLTAVPHYGQYSSNYEGRQPSGWSDRPHKEIGAVAKAVGVPYLDSHKALDRFIRGTPQTDYYYFRNMHFNPRGYVLWADAQISFLLTPSHKLLPASVYD